MKKRYLTLMLAALLALTALSGCQTQDTTWAFTYKEDTMPAGLYISMLMDSFGEALTQVQQTDAYELGMEPKDVYKMQLDGVTVSDWMITRAGERAREYYAVRDKMAEMGVVLEEAELESARQTAIDIMRSEQGDFYRKNGIGEQSLALAIEYEMARNALFLALYGEGGPEAVSDEEYVTLLTEKYAKAKLLMINKPREFELTEEESLNEETIAAAMATREAEAKARAEGYLARLQAGELIEDLWFEYSKELAAIDAAANNEEPYPVEYPAADDITTIIGRDQAATYGENMVNGIFAAERDVPALVEDESFYFILMRQDIAEELPDYRDRLLTELRSQTFAEQLVQWAGAVQLTPNEASIARYTPARIKAA